MTTYRIGLITAPSKFQAQKMAREIIKARLAACVNVIPLIQSVYWWKGKIEKGGESLLVVKTKKSLTRKLAVFVAKIHPYSVPEIIFIPIDSGHKPYLKWVESETQ